MIAIQHIVKILAPALLLAALSLATVIAKRPIPLVRTFTENLMAYGLGRRLESYDMPTIRKIVRDAAPAQNHFSSFILGIVKSPAFRMSRADATTH